MRLPFLPVIILALPILEIAGFIVVGKAIGLWATLGLVLASSILGAMLLRSGGAGLLQKMQAFQRDPSRQAELIGTGFTRMFAGLLLLVPGFITGMIGLLLLIPGFGNAIIRMTGARVVSSGSFRAASGQAQSDTGPRRPSGPDVVDLDENEYKREDDAGSAKNSPWSGGNLPDK